MNPEQIMHYAIQHTTAEDEILHQLYRETNLTTVYPRMLSGHMQGKFLELISKMIRPNRILEIGTFTGYSAICLARGLAPNGILHTIDINDELIGVARQYFTLAGLDNQIVIHVGDAIHIIPQINELFDLIFIDGDKEQYVHYYHQAFDKLRCGGFILADNVLWGGKVTTENSRQDKETKGILEFNDYVANDSRVEKLLLSIKDGMYIVHKLTN